MKSSLLPFALLTSAWLGSACSTVPPRDAYTTHARVNVAEDEAASGPYGDAWASGDNGGGGFTPWVLRVQGGSEPESHVGAFIARPGQGGQPRRLWREGAAFGFYANGTADERIAAVRGFQSPLTTGDAWSLLWEFPGFPAAPADAGGEPQVRFSLRNDRGLVDGAAVEQAELLGIRLDPVGRTLVIETATGPVDTGVMPDPEGMVLSVRVESATTVAVELEGLSGGPLQSFPGLALKAGSGERRLLGFAISVANLGPADFFFSGLQVNRQLPPRPGTTR